MNVRRYAREELRLRLSEGGFERPPSFRRRSLMRHIDEIHLQWPFYGRRKACKSLRTEGVQVNRKHMQRLMRVMGLESVAPKPDTSKSHPEHVLTTRLLSALASFAGNRDVWMLQTEIGDAAARRSFGAS